MNLSRRWSLAFLLLKLWLRALDKVNYTEICNFDVVVIIKEYILGLYISVDDILRVEIA